MNLFAMLRDAARPLVRIPLSAPAQNGIKALFEEQENTFRSSAETKIEFDGKYRPDEGECLTISDYDDIDNIHYALANPMNIQEIKTGSGEYDNIKAIFTGRAKDGDKTALIQSFDRRRVLSTKGYSIIEDITQPKATFKQLEGSGLTLDNHLSAILTDTSLDFFSFFAVRQVFDMTNYYQTATNDDLKAFHDNPKIKIQDFGNFVGVSDNWVRRKVILISQSGILEQIDVIKAKSAAAAFNITVSTETVDGKEVIVLPTDKKDLKLILKFLDEDYFHSVLTNVPHISNSKRKA